jgi:hypothetical protein
MIVRPFPVVARLAFVPIAAVRAVFSGVPPTIVHLLRVIANPSREPALTTGTRVVAASKK